MSKMLIKFCKRPQYQILSKATLKRPFFGWSRRERVKGERVKEKDRQIGPVNLFLPRGSCLMSKIVWC